MSVALELTYETKVGIRPKTVHVNQVWDDDMNEIKSVVKNHADRINQFTFNDPIDESIGINVTPTAQIHAKAKVGQSVIAKFERSGGGAGLEVSDDGKVYINSVVYPSNYNLNVNGSLFVGTFSLFGSTVRLNNKVLEFGGNALIDHSGSIFRFSNRDINTTSIYMNVDTGQLGVNTDNSFDASAQFEVKSTTRGSKPFPEMTEVQRLAIATPTASLHVYQTDGTEGVYVNKSTGWVFAY